MTRASHADTAQRVQLQLEYAPAPPFNAGSPDTAPASVVQQARQRAADRRSG